VVQEVAALIKMLLLKLTLSDDSVWYLAFHVHEKLEHLVVALAAEQNLTRVQFVYCAAGGPCIDSIIVRNTQNNFW